ncbi:uncharacterized protein PAC_14363 [Phialocephala subalpina]|uniref:Clr5 domain-containing protein n=1 Tax=Phialocephala subalpina TaxID=576137 RepID=A0A1L7XHD9_9HELO|nr:uncharacterized protein PAC_14363 [Phialocephala subalpina]
MDRYPSLAQISLLTSSSDALGNFDFMRNLNAHSVQTPVKPGKPCALSAQICRKVMGSVRTQGRKMDSTLLSPYLPLERATDSPLTPSHVAEQDANPRPQAHQTYFVDFQNKPQCQTTCIKSSHSGTTVKSPSKYRKEQWIEHQPEIHRLYIKEGQQLSTVKARMDSNGFHATEPMYKRKFKQWGWKKYRKIHHYTKSKESSAQPSHDNEIMVRSRTPDSKMTACFSVAHSAIVPYTSQAQFAVGKPTMMQPIELDKNMQTILLNIRSLYVGWIDQGKWKTANPRKVEERVYDDFLIEIAVALQNFGSLGPKVGGLGMQKVFRTLEKIVANCSLFSLPTIWQAFRMMREGFADIAERFLSFAVEWATIRLGIYHPFVKAIIGLRNIEQTDPCMLEQALSRTYLSCIEHVKAKLTPSHSTTLFLWADFVAYFGGGSMAERREVVDGLQPLIERSEAEHGRDHDYTLELLRMKLFVLRLTESMPDDAEVLARDLLDRVDRRMEDGATLEGFLLVLRRGLQRTLGYLCYARGDLKTAVIHLEDHLSHGVLDELDSFVLYYLEQWYTQLGELDEAGRKRQGRISLSEDPDALAR